MRPTSRPGSVLRRTLGVACAAGAAAMLAALLPQSAPAQVAPTGAQPWAWGDNRYGQLGDGTTTRGLSPVRVEGLAGVEAIATGSDHSLALRTDGTLWAWGKNFDGQLGDGTIRSRSSPVRVEGLAGVRAIAAGGNHSLALTADGTLWAWGKNSGGQLGDGTTTDRTAPVRVAGLSGVQAIAAGDQHSLALGGDGAVWAWGFNLFGQLGDGTSRDRSTPVRVTGLAGVQAIAAGGYHGLALTAEGTAWAWGRNFEGQLGDGTSTDRSIPVPVTGLPGVQAVAAGFYYNLALTADGTVWAWGDNRRGQLGDGTSGNFRSTPVRVVRLAGVRAIAGGAFHSLALMSDGSPWAWGYNLYSQLGDGTSGNLRSTPVRVTGLAGVQAIAAGGYHSLALVAAAPPTPTPSPAATPTPTVVVRPVINNFALFSASVSPGMMLLSWGGIDGHQGLALTRITALGTVRRILDPTWVSLSDRVTAAEALGCYMLEATSAAGGAGTVVARSEILCAIPRIRTPTGPGNIGISFGHGGPRASVGWTLVPGATSYVAIVVVPTRARAIPTAATSITDETRGQFTCYIALALPGSGISDLVCGFSATRAPAAAAGVAAGVACWAAPVNDDDFSPSPQLVGARFIAPSGAINCAATVPAPLGQRVRGAFLASRLPR